MKQRIFSGIKPTGTPHIGNYLGALKNWVALQDEYDCVYSVVDLHALTVPYEPKEFNQLTYELTAILLSIGIDPEKSAFFLQSMVPEHSELAWILGCNTQMGELNRMTQYKEKSEEVKEGATAGLFNYPILMAADILLYKTQKVPVGEDQVQHLELARILARRFNNRFGDIFVEPQPLLTHTPRVMSLKDPSKKMSKSVPGSYISLIDSDDTIRDNIRRAVTDSGSEGTSQKSPAIANLFGMLKAFADDKTYQKFDSQFADSTIRYSEMKEALAEAIVAEIAPIRTCYEELISDKEKLKNILAKGAQKVAPIAKETLKEVKQKSGLII